MCLLQAVDMLCARNITASEYATALFFHAQGWECLNAWSALDVEMVRRACHVLT